MNKFHFGLSLVALLVLSGGGYWWWQINRDQGNPETTVDFIYFSQMAERSSVVAHYPQNSVLIHSVNSYPSLLKIMDRAEIESWLTPDLVRQEASLAKDRQARASEFARSYVYQTSYFVGNLLITPEIHLLEALETRPYTAYVIEYALTDARAVVTQLQDVFDVAPPQFYEASMEPGVVYLHPSFPSLPTAEAYLTYLILAELNPANERHYALMAREYLALMRESGTHYQFDIDYARELMAEFWRLVLDRNEYQALLEAARAEWQDFTPAPLTWRPSPEALPGFRLARRTNVVAKTPSPVLSTSTSGYEGELILSLIDQRLPGPSIRLYGLDVRSEVISPLALDLTVRNFPKLSASSYAYSAGIEGAYSFVSAPTVLTNRYAMGVAPVSGLFSRSADSAPPVHLYGLPPTLQLDTLRSNRSADWWFGLASATSSSLWLIDTKNAVVVELPGVVAAAWRDTESLLILSDRGLESYQVKTGNRSSLLPIEMLPPGQSPRLAVTPDSDLVYILTHLYEDTRQQVNSTLSGYQIRDEQAVKSGEWVLEDLFVEAMVTNDFGDQLALLISDGITNIDTDVLIFDTNSGIINKVIKLNGFNPTFRSLDAWRLPI